LRLTIEAVSAEASEAVQEYSAEVPGEIVGSVFGIRLRLEASRTPIEGGSGGLAAPRATLRNWRPGDRVRLRYSSGPRKVKEVLERLRVTGSSRAVWPVLEVAGKIIWMKGVELEPEEGISVTLL
jgi:tRNA(Ile)-lysidine synthase